MSVIRQLHIRVVVKFAAFSFLKNWRITTLS